MDLTYHKRKEEITLDHKAPVISTQIISTLLCYLQVSLSISFLRFFSFSSVFLLSSIHKYVKEFKDKRGGGELKRENIGQCKKAGSKMKRRKGKKEAYRN